MEYTVECRSHARLGLGESTNPLLDPLARSLHLRLRSSTDEFYITPRYVQDLPVPHSRHVFRPSCVLRHVDNDILRNISIRRSPDALELRTSQRAWSVLVQRFLGRACIHVPSISLCCSDQ